MGLLLHSSDAFIHDMLLPCGRRGCPAAAPEARKFGPILKKAARGGNTPRRSNEDKDVDVDEFSDDFNDPGDR